MKYYICDWTKDTRVWWVYAGPFDDINQTYRVAQNYLKEFPYKYFGICEGNSIPNEVIPPPIQNLYNLYS